MPTRRFSDLTPVEQVEVLDSFLGTSGKVSFTEKLAGQHLRVVVNPDQTITYIGKGGTITKGGGLFPQVNSVLKKFHPKVNEPITYRFEVLKKYDRSDFIDYPLKKDFTAVELSGIMTQDIADTLNTSQISVEFLTRQMIEKNLSGVSISEDVKKELENYRQILLKKNKTTKSLAKNIELILMNLIDDGSIPSTLGGHQIEGLFGITSSGEFKIPTTSYSNIQKDQAKFFAVMRNLPMSTIEDRFVVAVNDPNADRMVSDVLEYIDKMSRIEITKGFRTYFSSDEIKKLKKISDDYRNQEIDSSERQIIGINLANQFFNRVKKKESWIGTGIVERWQRLAGIVC